VHVQTPALQVILSQQSASALHVYPRSAHVLQIPLTHFRPVQQSRFSAGLQT
jgi:hypothetical protein